MIRLFSMAWRDLGRNRRRSFFSALALAVGMALLLLMAATVTGEMRDALNASIRLQTGHIEVRAADYNPEKTSLKWEDLLEAPAGMADQIAALPQVVAATPRLYAAGILTFGDVTRGVRIVGVDVDSTANAPYTDGLVSGAFLAADDREGVLVGKELAGKIEAKPGDRINLMINTSSGEVDEQAFLVRGIYNTGMPGYDEATVIMPLAKAQAITGAGDRASSIFVLLKDREQADAVATALSANNVTLVTWSNANELLASFDQFAGAYMFVLYLIVLGITATVIINTLIMAVFERTREIGILSAVGMRSGRIMAMFFAESSLLAVGGIIMGLLLGGALVWYASVFGFYIGNYGASGILIGETIHAFLTWNDAILLIVMTFVITLLAALYPAFLASRMEPVEALHRGE